MKDALRIWTEPGRPLPGLELRLHGRRPHVTLGKNGKPKATGETIPPHVEVSTFPGHPSTTSPLRLRRMAAMLLEAADALDRHERDQDVGDDQLDLFDA